jgi:hypothetical protein
VITIQEVQPGVEKPMGEGNTGASDALTGRMVDGERRIDGEKILE